jgi:ElaA protein
MALRFRLCSFSELSTAELYAILAARSAVFVVEQRCPYQDLDGLDTDASHLCAWSGHELAGYLRLLSPGAKYAEHSIGRVLTTAAHRGRGIGQALMRHALQQLHAPAGIRINAQAYLARFYGSFGFERVSAPYLDDGIEHIEMYRGPGSRA